MEGVPKQGVPKAEEAPQALTEPEQGSESLPVMEESPEEKIEQPSTLPPVAEGVDEADAEKIRSDNIRLTKERLRASGGLTISPLEGDPFVLINEYRATPEGQESRGGVTIIKPDKTVTKMSLGEYQAESRRGRDAVRFVDQMRRVPGEVEQSSMGLAGRAMGWIKQGLSKLWSKLWGKAELPTTPN